MSTTAPSSGRPARGRRAYSVIGQVVRGVKQLPPVIREPILDRASGGVTAKLPPFADVLALVEAARGVPNGRAWQARLLQRRPDLRGVAVSEVESNDRGRVRARLYRPGPGVETTAALVWVHGGAFVIGSLDQQEAHWPALELAASGVAVLSVDYRLCINGVHYPEPRDDVLSSWRWAVRNIDQLGVPLDRLHLGGASAGACLVASSALRLRDVGEPLPASLYLAYPVLGGELPPAAPGVEPGPESTVGDGWIRDMFANWAGDADWRDPLVSPGLADLAGLPPTYVLTCGQDVLRRASEPFVGRLESAAVRVWHDLFPASEHAPLDRPDTADGVRALQRLRTWLAGGPDAMAG